MNQKLVYLAGPIGGFTLDDANNWRLKVSEVFETFPDDIKALSPLRGKSSYLKEIVGMGTIADHYDNKILSTMKGFRTVILNLRKSLII